MPELTIDVKTHHFVVRRVSARARPVVENFARRFIQYGTQRQRGGRYVKAALKVYAASRKDRKEYRFHINTLQDFLAAVDADYIRGSMLEITYHAVPSSQDVELVIQPHWHDRPHQPPVIEYMVSDAEPRSKLVSLKTGKGKSYCSMRAMKIRGKRTLFIVKPKYVDKWIEDLQRTYSIDTEDIMVIRGGDQLRALLLMAETGILSSKIIILSNRTLQAWITLYEDMGEDTLEMGYACLPENLCEHLNVGMRIIDEVHEDFHLNFKIDLYTHVEYSISLSATLTSYDPELERMYSIAYPVNLRFTGPKFDNYIVSRAVYFRFRNMNKIRHKDPATGNYSHHALEQSILRDEDIAMNYFDMVNSIFKGTYGKINRPMKDGQMPRKRCLIFASSIAMCTALASYFAKKYPTLDVRRYVEEDPYTNLEGDVIVSTIFSAGTGIDIPDLVTTIMTTAMLSKQGNIQGHGRLRELADGTQPEFAYLVCTDISKHVEYHKRKAELLMHESVVFREDTFHDRI